MPHRNCRKIGFLNDSRFWTCDILISDFVFQNAVSVYIRLGFAHKKGEEMDEMKLHHSWTEKVNSLAMKR